jgi:hypothetical protein
MRRIATSWLRARPRSSAGTAPETSPGFHFADAARDTAQPQPENLRGHAARILKAYNIHSWEQIQWKEIAGERVPAVEEISLKGGRDPFRFAAALEAKGMALAQVTKDEAERTQKEAEHWEDMIRRIC